jgi:GNAT superfamily N-acetyltransferase
VATRTACSDDLPAVLSLIRQHRAAAHAEGVLTGQAPLGTAAVGFARLLTDPGHRVVLAVRPGTTPGSGNGDEVPVGLAILGVDPISTIMGRPQVTVDTFVVDREHRRQGAGAGLLAAAVAFAVEIGADHVVVAVSGHDAERQRFLSRMGFAPLTTRRIATREGLARTLAAWQRSWPGVPAPRRGTGARRRPGPRVSPPVAVADG